MNPLPCNPCVQTFKTLKFLNDLVFYQAHPMNMYFHKRGHVFVVQKEWHQLYDFMSSFWLFFKKMYFKHLIPLVYRFKKTLT
jgi:hypothetical protein